MSLTEYVRAFCVIKNQKTTLRNLGNRNDSAEENETDDKNAGDRFIMQFWKMPLYNEYWLENLSMQLTKSEGEFLKDQIIHNCPNTMISYILKNDMTKILDCQYFSDLGALMSEFPEHIQENYSLALAFSDFMYVIRTLYNIIVSDGYNQFANEEFESLKEEFVDRANIDVDHIMLEAGVVKQDLKNFLKQMQVCMQNNDIEGMKKHIKDREILLKGANRAKTAHPGEFDPTVWIGGGELDYRFRNAKTIIRDIFESEGKVNVKS